MVSGTPENDEGSKSDAVTLNEPERGSSGVDMRGGAPNGLAREGAAAGAGATTGAGAGAGAITGAGAVAPCRMKGFVTAGVGATAVTAGAGITGGGTTAGFPNGFPADVGETDAVNAFDAREAIGANELTSMLSYLSARAAQIP